MLIKNSRGVKMRETLKFNDYEVEFTIKSRSDNFKWELKRFNSFKI